MSAASDSTASYEQAVRTWTRHLRSGGSTPWSAWSAAAAADPLPADGPADEPAGGLLPSAAQLELVRRAARQAGRRQHPGAARQAVEAVDAFAEVVLSRSGPGRGRAHQPLSWPGRSPRIGAPPVDPSDVPIDELVRLAVGALTQLLLTAPTGSGPTSAASTESGPRRRLLPAHRPAPAFVLVGAPVTASVVRRRLAAAGHHEGGRSPVVVVLAEPLDRALAQVWSARVQRGAPVRWSGFCRRWAGRDRLPPSADPVALARPWVDRVGAERVHVLVAPPTAEQAAGAVAAILGGRSSTPGSRVAEARLRDLSPAGVDVLRRVNAVLAVRADDARRADALRTVLPLLDGVPAPSGLAVPERLRDWLDERATGLADELASAVYRVHGTPGTLVPGAGSAPTRPRRADVLRVAVGAGLSHLDPGPAASGGGVR